MQTILPPSGNTIKILGKPKPAEHGLRWMTYVLAQPVEGGVLVFHTLTRALLLLTPEEYAAPDNLPELRDGWFCVPQEMNDQKYADQVRFIRRTMWKEPEHITSYTIFTTTDCNARCFYCYEMGRSRIPMSNKTAHKAAAYIAAHCGGEKVHLHYHKIHDTFNEKYADVKQRLIPDAKVPYRFHFTPEDFYVFVIAHAYKHYSRSGTGIRTLADIYIMNQKLGGTMNWEYVDSELRGLSIFSYEHESRELAQKIFGIAELPTKANLSEAEQQMLAYYLGASTYGTIENRILNQMQKLQPDDGAFTARTKRKYLLSRIFPGREWCEAYAPTVYKYPVLLPFFWVWRLIYKGITNRKKVTQEIKTIKAGKQN